MEHLNDNIYILGEEKGNGNLLRYKLLGVKNWEVKKQKQHLHSARVYLRENRNTTQTKHLEGVFRASSCSSLISLVQFRTKFKLCISVFTVWKLKSAPVWITSSRISSSICVLNTFLEFYTYFSRDIIYKRTERIFCYLSLKTHFALDVRNLNCNENTAVVESRENGFYLSLCFS